MQVVPTGVQPTEVPVRVVIDRPLADKYRLGADRVFAALADLTARADLWLNDLFSLPFDKGRLVKLRRVIEYRRRQLAPAARR